MFPDPEPGPGQDGRDGGENYTHGVYQQSQALGGDYQGLSTGKGGSTNRSPTLIVYDETPTK